MNTSPTRVDSDLLATSVREASTGVVFALVMGSARDGVVRAHSDLDLACWFREIPSLEERLAIARAVELVCPSVRCDLGILNGTEPVYRYEALKGRLLFTRDEDLWYEFFAQTCRQYEYQMADYERQLRYRRDAVA